MRTVGMIGLGKMGLPLSANLLDRGFAVVGFCRSGSPGLEAAGGQVLASPAEVAGQADVLVSILPTADAVEQVVLGPSGTLTALRPGVIHIEMSTIDVDRKRRIRDAVRERGGDLLDCPISGSPGMVAPRLARPFVSGEPASVAQVRDVLDALSGPWVETGAFGTGTQMKYISAMLMAAHTVAAAEAIVLARRSGLDLELVQRTLDGSIAGSALLKQRGPVMQTRTWAPAPGPVYTLHAILEQVDECLSDIGMPAPVFTAAKELFDKSIADGWGDLDIACVHDQISGDHPLAGDTA
jgi:3-hydroxyisobutyrate dehydrogenase